MIYKATISSTPLRLRESRVIADLLLRSLSEAEWRAAIVDDNILQMGKPVTIIRSARIMRARLEPMGRALWEMVRDGGKELATQATLAGAIQHSRLLGDFMDLTMRDQRAVFATHLEPRMWADYIEGCRGRDPDMAHWSDSTIDKLRSIVFSMLADAAYLKDTRSLQLQNVFVDPGLVSHLYERGNSYVLRCLQVTE